MYINVLKTGRNESVFSFWACMGQIPHLSLSIRWHDLPWLVTRTSVPGSAQGMAISPPVAEHVAPCGLPRGCKMFPQKGRLAHSSHPQESCHKLLQLLHIEFIKCPTVLACALLYPWKAAWPASHPCDLSWSLGHLCPWLLWKHSMNFFSVLCHSFGSLDDDSLHFLAPRIRITNSLLGRMRSMSEVGIHGPQDALGHTSIEAVWSQAVWCR